MADGRILRLALSDDTRVLLTLLLSETEIGIDTLASGVALLAQKRGHSLPELALLTGLANQAAESITHFAQAFRTMLDSAEAANA